MKKKDAVEYFGNQSKLAAALGITPHSVFQWGDEVPALRAYQLERITGGQLKAEAINAIPND